LFDDGIDKYDALKFNNARETFGLERMGKIISIERRKEVITEDTLFFYITRTNQRKYQFGIYSHQYGSVVAGFFRG